MNAKSHMGSMLKQLSLVVILSLLTVTAKAAELVKDFTLKAVPAGEDFKLSAQKGKFVVLHFLLKTECPICLKHTREYIAQGKDLPNTVQVFIKPDEEADIRQWTSKIPGDLLKQNPIYRDPDAKLAKDLKIPDDYKFHGQVVHYPALILINPQGEEVFRHVGKNNADRYPIDQLKAKIGQLSK
ncbi:MAG TPA: redoxin domain-containing protein [Verrucomicrobiae bacterium]